MQVFKIFLIFVFWIYRIQILNCEEITCEAPPIISKAVYSPKDISEFQVGKILTYSCDFGYVSNQAYFTTKCVLSDDKITANWTSINLTCRPRSCGDPGALNHGTVIGSVFTFPNNITYLCDDGYKIQGQIVRFCQTNGKWSGFLPSCIKIQCNKPDLLQNGRVHYDSLEYESELRYECNDGLQLIGQQIRICEKDGKWTDETPSCIEMKCEEPGQIANGQSNLPGNIPKVGSTVFYSCNENHKLVGSMKSKCLASGMWSFPPPVCQKICIVPDILDGQLIYYEKSYYGRRKEVSIPTGSKIDDSRKIFLKCDDKYTSHSGSKTTEMSCLDGVWSSELECSKKMCIVPDILNGHLIYYEWNFGMYREVSIPTGSKVDDSQQISLKCDYKHQRSKTTEINCLNGVWTSELKCLEESCNGIAPIVPFGELRVFETEPGTVLWYACNKNYYKAKSGYVVCEHGEWIGNPPICKDARCYLEDNMYGLKLPKIKEWRSGTVHIVSCENGYDISKQDNGKIQCIDGEWQGAVPPCIPHNCTTLPNAPKNGKIVKYSNIHRSLVEYTCNEHYILKQSENPIRCELGKWIGDMPKCEEQEKQCIVTDVENGSFLIRKVREYRNIFGDIADKTTFHKAVLNSQEKTGSTLYVNCNPPYIFQGKDGAKYAKVTCENGQWIPTPSCFKRGEFTEEPIVKETDETTKYEYVTPPQILGRTSERESLSTMTISEILITETEDDCFCTVNIQDENLLAFSDNRLLKFGDKVKKGCKVKFLCKIFGYHRLMGSQELICSNCKWHSSEFPTCASPKPGDVIVQVVSEQQNNFALSSTGKLIIPPKINIHIICRSTYHYPQLVDSHNTLEQRHFIGLEGEEYIYNTVFYMNSVTPKSSEKYACEIPHTNNRLEFEIEVDEEKCPIIIEKKGISINYENERKISSKATFSCLNKNTILKGSDESICLADGKWSIDTPECERHTPVQCPNLNETENLKITYTNKRNVNSSAIFTCIEPYKRIGVAVITCLLNGEWSDSTTTCHLPTCSVNSIYDALPDYAVPLGLENVASEVVPYGTTLNMGCADDNHLVVGKANLMQCNELGHWVVDKIKCIPGCNFDRKLINSDIIISPIKDIYKLGDFIIFSCPPDQVLTSDVQRIMCLLTGWSDEFPKCSYT